MPDKSFEKQRNPHIFPLLVGHAMCGLAAAASVAPAIAIVDQSIFANASGREPMLACIKRESKTLFTQPTKFIKQPALRWIMFVYGSTYVVANCGQVREFCSFSLRLFFVLTTL
jgi:hypothetical protein